MLLLGTEKPEIQILRNENSSQTNDYSHYSNHSYSGLIPNERSLSVSLSFMFCWFPEPDLQHLLCSLQLVIFVVLHFMIICRNLPCLQKKVNKLLDPCAETSFKVCQKSALCLFTSHEKYLRISYGSSNTCFKIARMSKHLYLFNLKQSFMIVTSYNTFIYDIFEPDRILSLNDNFDHKSSIARWL